MLADAVDGVARSLFGAVQPLSLSPVLTLGQFCPTLEK
jgi:hypothetical protein